MLTEAQVIVLEKAKTEKEATMKASGKISLAGMEVAIPEQESKVDLTKPFDPTQFGGGAGGLPPGVEAEQIPPAAGELLGAGTGGGAVRLRTATPVESLQRLTAWALENGIELERLEVRRPSLEDIYLELTEAVAK